MQPLKVLDNTNTQLWEKDTLQHWGLIFKASKTVNLYRNLIFQAAMHVYIGMIRASVLFAFLHTLMCAHT